LTVRFWLIAAVSLAALLSAGCGQGKPPPPTSKPDQPARPVDKSRPNIVLISVDTLRPDHLGCYGYSRNTSPNIDRLAGEGAVFENVISSTSWTLPAHCAMFTGLCDSVHGATEADRVLHEGHTTLAERLKQSGFATVGFFSGPFLHPVFGLSQGFDEYIDCSSYPQIANETVAETGSLTGRTIWREAYRDITSPKILQQVEAWLDQRLSQPFFMFIHMWDVHFDFIPPPPYDTKFDPDYTGTITGENFFTDPRINANLPRRDIEHLIALYDGEIGWTDEHIGKIVGHLEQLGLLDSTILVVTADHGTAFFEHGAKGHRNSLFDELIRIPLIIRYPTLTSAGQRHPEQARMIDLMPTVLRLVGLRPGPVMGQSLVPLLRGGKLKRIEPAISELFFDPYELRSFRRPERKTVWDLENDRGLVYDLTADPGELTPITDRDSPIVHSAAVDMRWSRKFLKAFRERYPQSPPNADIPEDVRRKLEQLGYVGPAEPNEAESQEAEPNEDKP
jgi:arylsulfatase A-like enzyme